MAFAGTIPRSAALRAASVPAPMRIVRSFAESAVAEAETKPKTRTKKSTEIKKPPTAYALFLKDNFTKIAQTLEGTRSVPAVASEISKHWKALSESEKDQYKQRATAGLEEHYKTNPRPVKAAKAKRSGAMSGYNLYMKENTGKSSSTNGTDQKSRFKEVAGAWKNLPQHEKDDYNSRAKAMATQQ